MSRQRRQETQHDTGTHQPRTLGPYQTAHVVRLRAEGYANADLAAPLTDAHGNDAVQSDRCQRHARRAKTRHEQSVLRTDDE